MKTIQGLILAWVSGFSALLSVLLGLGSPVLIGGCIFNGDPNAPAAMQVATIVAVMVGLMLFGSLCMWVIHKACDRKLAELKQGGAS